MKINGFQNTFHYDSSYWSDKNYYGLPVGAMALETNEVKVPTYWNTPFTKICLGMEVNGQRNFIVIEESANSLYSLIADGEHRDTFLGRDKWKTLIGAEASLQTNCNQEGFNSIGGCKQCAKARIDILGNQENDCNSCDSRIGFGTGGSTDDSNTCGNEAAIGPDNGDKHIKAMGYILVQ
ncbi:putative skeletal organic matrix protein 5 isoform X1 [Oculina patagonica]